MVCKECGKDFIIKLKKVYLEKNNYSLLPIWWCCTCAKEYSVRDRLSLFQWFYTFEGEGKNHLYRYVTP
jgi:hypothetical protein